MKKYIVLLIAVVLVLAGLVGSLVCAIPGHTKEYNAINKYINAVDDCDLEKMMKVMPLEELSSALGVDASQLMGAVNMVDTADKTAFIKALGMNVTDLMPEDAKEIKKVRLVSSTKTGQSGASMGIAATRYSAVVELTYVDAQDQTVKVLCPESFDLIQTQKGVKLIP